MKFISAQPDNLYFVWQLYIQLYNFQKLGIAKDYIILMGFREDMITKEAIELKKYCDTFGAKIYFFPDSRHDLTYLPSMKPHLMKQFFNYHSSSEPFFYIDSDVIFTDKLPDFKKFCKGDKWYLSDTVSYIGAEYIISKSPELLKGMCQIVGISEKVVIENEKNSGGAQYLIKNTDYYFWNKVEGDCYKLFEYMKRTEKQYCPEHPIQYWCAEMWATLWNAWLRGIKTKVVPQIDFCWPNNDLTEWDNKYIYHNAGVIKDETNLFYKGAFLNKVPFGESFDHVSKDRCSIKYVEQLLATGEIITKIFHFSK